MNRQTTLRLLAEHKPRREWRFYLDDMIGFCQRVQAFTTGIDQGQFVSDSMRFDATVFPMLLANLQALKSKISQ